MPSDAHWQGGDNFVKIKRGSSLGGKNNMGISGGRKMAALNKRGRFNAQERSPKINPQAWKFFKEVQQQ